MEMNLDMCKLVCELEYLIGKECYNPHSYDGWNDIQGCCFRYPVHIKLKIGENIKDVRLRCNLNESHGFVDPEKDFNPNVINNLKYSFGANEMYIGAGIQNILNYLEERYSLNFNKLKKNTKTLTKINYITLCQILQKKEMYILFYICFLLIYEFLHG